jgi:hypothetical protein
MADGLYFRQCRELNTGRRVDSAWKAPPSIVQRQEFYMKSLTATAFALGLFASPLAMAQTSTAPSPATPPAAATNTSDSSTQPQWYSHRAGEIRASKLIGTTVKNPGNETIGDINEVILDNDGRVAALIIGVGGFLGMGERQVAVDFKSVRLSQEGNSTVVMFNATKDGLKSAPAWTWASDTGTTGTSSTPATKPMPERSTK